MDADKSAAGIEARRERMRHFPMALLLLMVFSSLLVAWRVQQFELEIARDRAGRQAVQLAVEIERAFSFGMSVRDMAFLGAMLEKKLAEDGELVAAWVSDERAEIVASRGSVPVAKGFKVVWNQRLARGRGSSFSAPPVDFYGMAAFDPLGQPAAKIWLAHDRSHVFARGERAIKDLIPWGLAATLAALMLFVVLRYRKIVAADCARRSIEYVVLLTLTLVVVVPIVIKAQSLAGPLIDTQISTSARMLGRDVATQIERATALGVPLNRLSGVDEVLRGELEHAREFSYLQLRDVRTGVLAAAGAPGVPADARADAHWAETLVDVAGSGIIAVGYPRDYVSRMLRLAVGDLLFAVLIAGVLVWELAQAIRLPGARANLEDGQAQIRLFVFVVSLTEELLRPFFAPFAAETDSAWAALAALSPTWLAGLPVMVFMTALAFSQPAGAALAGRFDLRRSMIATASLGATTLAAAGLTTDTLLLSLLRGINGITYGLSLIFAQMAILRLVDPEWRARALAEFATAIVAAGIVGPALGAIAAERFGFQVAFVVCAMGYVAAVAVACRLHTDNPAPGRAVASLQALKDFLRNGGTLAVTMLAAIPARLLAAAVLLLITPLYLAEMGEATTVIGRVLPLYFVAFLVTAPWVARASDRSGRRKPFVVVGCLLSGGACALLPWIGGTPGAAMSCLLLGVGQAVLSAPQMALITELCATRGHAAVEQGVASFRFIERAGSIAAAPAVAVCVNSLGLSGSLAVLGVVAVLGGALLWLILQETCGEAVIVRGDDV